MNGCEAGFLDGEGQPHQRPFMFGWGAGVTRGANMKLMRSGNMMRLFWLLAHPVAIVVTYL